MHPLCIDRSFDAGIEMIPADWLLHSRKTEVYEGLQTLTGSWQALQPLIFFQVPILRDLKPIVQ
jgi:hypothetical protein